MQPSDEIKQRLDIVDLIREYIQLKPAGVNFKANCPFHREKTPSFIVSPEKQIWHCFGCAKGGDIFSFIMEMEGISFVDALRQLAPKAGVTLKKQDPKTSSQRNRALDVMDAITIYYHKKLVNEDSTESKSAMDYLKKRDLKEETIQDWQIGYAPESWDDALVFLKNKGFSEQEIFLAGISVKKEGTNKFYNRFRGRIMFPIKDANGQTIAFSARILPEKEKNEKLGKYINNPQTIIYDKSKILFGLDKAKLAIKNEDLAVVAEGQMDVITAHQNGFKNVVASSGTALTRDQLILLKRYSNKIALAFDADEAGAKAAERGIFEAMLMEIDVKIILIPEGKDPDDFIKKNPKNWEKINSEAKPMMQYYFDKSLSGLNLDEIEDKRLATQRLLNIIAKLGNRIEQDFWLKKLAEKIDVQENLLREALKNSLSMKNKYSSSNQANEKKKTENKIADIKKNREKMLSELFLALLFKFSSLIEYAASHLNIEQLVGKKNGIIYKNLIIYYNNVIDNRTLAPGAEKIPSIKYSGFKSWLENTIIEVASASEDNFLSDKNQISLNILNLLDRLVLLGDKDFYDFSLEQAKSELDKIIITLKKYYLNNRMKEITKLISDSEKNGNFSEAKKLTEELKSFSDEIRITEK